MFRSTYHGDLTLGTGVADGGDVVVDCCVNWSDGIEVLSNGGIIALGAESCDVDNPSLQPDKAIVKTSRDVTIWAGLISDYFQSYSYQS